MKITIAKLKALNACDEGKQWFLAQSETNGKKLIQKLVDENKLDFANWAIVKLLNRKQRIQYAIFAAEQVIEIFETQYFDDKRPRDAINAAKTVLEHDTKKNRAAANAAAYAAYAANAAANAAAYAANAFNAANAAAYAAYAAANAAAYAAYAAANAFNAANAANAAANAAADADNAAVEMKTKIISYGLSLIK